MRERAAAAEAARLEGQDNGQGIDTGADGGAGSGSTGGAGSSTSTGTSGSTGSGAEGGAGSAGGSGSGGQESANGAGNVPDSTERLTPEAYAEMMRNKTNVMAALKDHGVEFSDRDGADVLRDQLNELLAAKGLLPDGN